SEAQRDRAIFDIEKSLSRYGDRYRYTNEDFGRWDRNGDQAQLTFPPLDHPASDGDVGRGAAIFTLAGGRPLKLPARPLRAKWITLKSFPQTQVHYDQRTKRQTQSIGYDQDGWVWQAEEAAGRRFYGFVGRHVIARVPADEIEFPDPWNAGELSGQ